MPMTIDELVQKHEQQMEAEGKRLTSDEDWMPSLWLYDRQGELTMQTSLLTGSSQEGAIASMALILAELPVQVALQQMGWASRDARAEGVQPSQASDRFELLSLLVADRSSGQVVLRHATADVVRWPGRRPELRPWHVAVDQSKIDGLFPQSLRKALTVAARLEKE